MSPVAVKTVVAGGVVYPAGAAVPDDVAEGITASGVFDNAAELAVGDWAKSTPVATVEEIAAAAAALGFVLTPKDALPEGGVISDQGDPEDSESEDDEDEGAPTGTDVDYSAPTWTVDALKAEISTRNSYREPDAQLSTSGKRADLVAVLAADDKA